MRCQEGGCRHYFQVRKVRDEASPRAPQPTDLGTLRHVALWETTDPQGAPIKYDEVAITAALDKSLAALQTPYIDLYQVHWPLNMDSAASTVAALEAAKASGKIRHYGVCNYGTEDLAEFQSAGGKPLTNQLPYNLLWRSIEERIVPACMQDSVGVLVYSPLQQGLLGGKAASPADVSEGRRRTRLYSSDSSEKTCHGAAGLEEEVFGSEGVLPILKAICERHSCSMADASLGWLLTRPGVSCVLVGASSPEQVIRNATLPSTVSQELLKECSEATEPLRQALLQQGNPVDQYAKLSRIRGT